MKIGTAIPPKLLICIGLATIIFSCNKIHVPEDDTKAILIVQDSCHVVLPNSFTPNGDGKNDQLRAIHNGLNPANYKMKVCKDNYRRNVVFETTNLSESWDGGKQKTGRYIVSIQGTFDCDESFIQYGYVHLYKDCVPNDQLNNRFFENMFDPMSTSFNLPANEKMCN